MASRSTCSRSPVTSATAAPRRVEDLLWELIPEASHLREDVGTFADPTNQQAKSYPLALTQLLIAYHMVKAALGVHAV